MVSAVIDSTILIFFIFLFISEYGFAEKVVEGMFLEVGCVIIKIESQTFRASLQLWQLQGYSVSPTWQQSDLRFTRLTHPQRGEVTVSY